MGLGRHAKACCPEKLVLSSLCANILLVYIKGKQTKLDHIRRLTILFHCLP